MARRRAREEPAVCGAARGATVGDGDKDAPWTGSPHVITGFKVAFVEGSRAGLVRGEKGWGRGEVVVAAGFAPLGVQAEGYGTDGQDDAYGDEDPCPRGVVGG